MSCQPFSFLLYSFFVLRKKRNLRSSYTLRLDVDSFAFAFTLFLENYRMWVLGFEFFFFLGVYWVMPKELLDLQDYWQDQFGRNRIKSSIQSGRPFLITWCIVFGVKEKLELSKSVNRILEVNMQNFQHFLSGCWLHEHILSIIY